MNKKRFEAFAQVLEHIIKYFRWVVLAAAVLLVLSGVYRVDGNEAAVVLRFGRPAGGAARVKKPGLHFALPFMIDEVIKVPVKTVQEKEVTAHYSPNGFDGGVGGSGYLLTGDNNVVLIRAMVKYQISDAARYALYCRDPERMIDGVVSGEMTRCVTRRDIDAVLTSGKAQLSSEIIGRAQAQLDALETGVALTNIELTDIVPPNETKDAFEEVISAAVSRETGIQKAREEAAALLLGAQAQATAFRQDAIAQQNARLSQARAEMAQFNGLYDQYRSNPQIIRAGTFRERVGALIAKMGGAVIVPDGQTPVVVLP